MAVTEEKYQVCNADNASGLKPASVDFPHTVEGLKQAREEARKRSARDGQQVVLQVTTTTGQLAWFQGGREIQA